MAKKTSVTVRAAWIMGICTIAAAIIGLLALSSTTSSSSNEEQSNLHDKKYEVYVSLGEYHREVKKAAGKFYREYPTSYSNLLSKGNSPKQIKKDLIAEAHMSIKVDCHTIIPELNLLFPKTDNKYWKNKISLAYDPFEEVMEIIAIANEENNLSEKEQEINVKLKLLDERLSDIVTEVKKELEIKN